MTLLLALLLVAAREAPPVEREPPTIEHKPVTSAPRGTDIEISAVITNPSGVYEPQVVVRPLGSKRFLNFLMDGQGDGVYAAQLPATLLSGGGLDYFIEAYDELGNGPARAGTPEKPFRVTAFEAPPKPARLVVRTDPVDAEVAIDGGPTNKAGAGIELSPGQHVVSVIAKGHRPSETRLELQAGRELDMLVTLAEGRGPGALRVRSDPPGARVLLDGTPLGNTPFAGPLQPGAHELAVELAGHLRVTRLVLFEEGHDVEESFALPVLPRGPALLVESSPVGALVVIDGVDKGRTPWVGPLGAGPHQAVLRMQGRREVGTEFEMPAQRDLALKLNLPEAKAPRPPRLTVNSTASGTLFIDGKQVGPTPWSGPIAVGAHKLEVKSPGFSPQAREIQVAAERDVDAAFALERLPGPGALSVESDPAGAEISIDGKVVGNAPVQAPLAPGEHQVAARAEGRREVGQVITVEAGQRASLRLALSEAPRVPEPPQIQVNTQPQGVAVLLDGQPIGSSPVRAMSTPGPHEVKLSLDGYRSRNAKFKIPENRDVTLVFAVALKPTREIDSARTASPTELARASNQRAFACYKQGDFACALAGYQAAYEQVPLTALLFNIGQSRRKLGQLAEAAASYRSVAKEAVGTPLGAEAQRQAEACDQRLKAPAAAPPSNDEDTAPPLLSHEPIKSVERGVAFRLVAAIRDDRSGVFEPRACLRNLFATEWVCLPMEAAGGDTFAVEVPARFVTDGLAYYLEAYDTVGNGPARAGGPDKPNAVSLVAPSEKPHPVGASGAQVAAPDAAVATDAQTAGSLRHARLAGWIGLGTGAAALIVGTGLALSARSITANDKPTVVNGVTFHTISAQDAQTASDRRGASLLFFGGGAALAASAGAFLFLLPSGSGGQAGVAGTF